MTLALAFYGQPRFVRDAYSYIYNNIIVNNNISHIYAHLWSSSNIKNNAYKVQIADNNFEENLNNFRNLYNPTDFIFEHQQQFIPINTRIAGNSGLSYIEDYFNFAFISAWYSRRRIINKIYEEYKNITHVIIHRTDGVVRKPFTLKIDNKIHVLRYGNYTLSDNMMYGPIQKFYEIFNQDIPKVTDGTAEILMHYLISLKESDIDIYSCDYDIIKSWSGICE